MSITNGHWRELPPLTIARSHSPVIAHQEKLYIFGGGGPNFKSLNSVVCYDPQEDRWQELAPMPSLRSGTAAFLADGKMYIVGGGFKKPDGNFQFLKTVEIYDPTTDTWSQGPDMLQPHDYPAAAELDGWFYIMGGHHPDACLGGPKTDPGFDFCERWRPGEPAWQAIKPMPTPRFAAAAISHERQILTSGGVAFRPEGFNNFDFFETYEPDKDCWQQPDTLRLPWPAAGHVMCRYGKGLFFIGGFSTDNIHARAAYYSMSTQSWDRLPDMPMPRAAMGSAIINKTLYLVGGWADDGRTPMNSVVAYQWG